MVSSMEALSFPSKSMVISQFLPNQGWAEALATFWTERRNARREKTRECTGKSSLHMRLYHIGHSATKLKKDLCSPADTSFIIKMEKKKRKIMGFSPYLNPVSAICHEIKVPKRDFPIVFGYPSQIYIFWGYLKEACRNISITFAHSAEMPWMPDHG